jgi:hypothetical protein
VLWTAAEHGVRRFVLAGSVNATGLLMNPVGSPRTARSGRSRSPPASSSTWRCRTAQEHVIDLTGPRSPDLAILRDPQVLVAMDGHLRRPTGPGLGIEVDEDAVRAGHRPDLLVPAGKPRWDYPDGSFAEW